MVYKVHVLYFTFLEVKILKIQNKEFKIHSELTPEV